MTPTDGTASAALLVVEDDRIINDGLAARLRGEGFTVTQAYDGPEALDAVERDQPDLVLLDVMLPGLDGIEVCRRIQARRPIPVLMLTARAEEADVLVGLAVGADDYVTKPFRAREVVARVRALLRRVARAEELTRTAPSRIDIGTLAIDAAARRVWAAGDEVHLAPLEFDLLLCLAAQPGTVRSRDELMREVWGWADARGTRTLDTHVRTLRAKIGAARVRTVHGVGYSVEAA